jgi:hypothetical protein
MSVLKKEKELHRRDAEDAELNRMSAPIDAGLMRPILSGSEKIDERTI